MAKETPIKYYRLKRPFWDNKEMQPKGKVLPFLEGKQPSTAVLVTDAEIEAMSAAEKAVSVTVGLPDGFYDEVVAEVTAKVLAAINQEEAATEANADKGDSADGGSTSADPKAKK